LYISIIVQFVIVCVHFAVFWCIFRRICVVSFTFLSACFNCPVPSVVLFTVPCFLRTSLQLVLSSIQH